ncbi:hypothetical protein L1887_05506 [Cichorium endivia]|nr:hypothetical protein L1887_05506 [Cichorium endivia]
MVSPRRWSLIGFQNRVAHSILVDGLSSCSNLSQKFVLKSLSVLDNSKYEIDSLGLTIPSIVEDPIKPSIENHEEIIVISGIDLDNSVVEPLKDDLMIVGTKLETGTQEIDSAGILIPLGISDLITTEIKEPIVVLEFNEAVLD